MLQRIVSGGQTGADRAALDWAISRGIPHEGWCPAGRRAEDGPLPERYQLQDTPDRNWSQRTRWNVRDSEATVILSLAPKLSGGSLLTLRIARELRKPVLHISGSDLDPAGSLAQFVEERFAQVLNVAGPRASTEPGIAAFVTEVLDLAFPE